MSQLQGHSAAERIMSMKIQTTPSVIEPDPKLLLCLNQRERSGPHTITLFGG